MMDKELQKEILDSIANSGAIESHDIINGNMVHVISRSSGMPRFQTNVLRKFQLILSRPTQLKDLHQTQIRCALCNRVISYPAWYYSVKYAVNHFHYFVCFDSSSADRPSTKCYRRENV